MVSYQSNQVVRNGLTLRTRLAQLLTEGTSPNPRWLIKFEGPYKDEEVYEHTFGAVLEAADDVSSDSPTDSRKSAPRPPSVGNAKKLSASTKAISAGANEAEQRSTKGAEGNVEAAEDDAETNKAKKSVSFSNENSPGGSEESSTPMTEAERKKVSAREQRSRRRQAIIDEHPAPLLPGGAEASVPSNGKRRLGLNGKMKNKRSRGEGDDECVKIKFLTGTLYLYRGTNRRAEFVRRI